MLTADRAMLEDAPAYGAMTPEEQAPNAAEAEQKTGEEMATDAANAVGEGGDELADRAAVAATATPETMTTETLTCARVYDSNDEWIGEVSELILGDTGDIMQAVIDVRGFLGIGEKPVALSMDQLDILQADTGAEVRLYLPMSEDELVAMPRFEG